MKRLVFGLFLIASQAVAWAAKDFVMSPDEQEVVHPKSIFHADEAKQALGPGNCSLRGVAYQTAASGFLEKKKPPQYPPKGSKIYLFPYNEYTREVVHLFKENDPPRSEHSMDTLMAEARLKLLTGQGIPEILPVKRVEVDPAFPKIWRSALIGPKGAFAFEGLKPGRYYLQSMTFMVGRNHEYSDQVGEEVQETYWSNGEVSVDSRPIWADKSTTMYHKVELVGVFEVAPGENQSIELNEDWKDFDAP